MRFSLNKTLAVEVFVLLNFAFLTVDIYLAHSFNSFRHPAEWVPFWFSMVASVLMFLALALRLRSPKVWSIAGYLLGAGSILVGLTGMLFHLNSQFFAAQSIESLVYTAPFAAPLAYAGLGFLLLLNRMVDSEHEEWGQWILFLAMGAFVGNFVLSLCDHAQNDFFEPMEWAAVVSAALGVGFLTTAVVRFKDQVFLKICLVLMGLEAVIGILGFSLHLKADLEGATSHVLDSVIYGAPILAPLLFANIAVLAGIGLWNLTRRRVL